MKKMPLLFLFLTVSILLYLNCKAETTDLDLIILQNPRVELKKAAKKGQLEKLVRIIKLADQKKIDPEIFKDSSLMSKAEKREIKNNRYSKKYLFFRGFLWTALVGTLLIPAGAWKEIYYIDIAQTKIKTYLDYTPLMVKGLFSSLCLWYLKLSKEGKASMIKDAQLVNQLVKKYHQKSLAN